MPLDKIYDQIEEELRNQYNMGYTPNKPGGGYHKVLVSVKRKNLTGPRPRRIYSKKSNCMSGALISQRGDHLGCERDACLRSPPRRDVLHHGQSRQRPGNRSR